VIDALNTWGQQVSHSLDSGEVGDSAEVRLALGTVYHGIPAKVVPVGDDGVGLAEILLL